MLDSEIFKQRKNGVLMHISSLPGESGIGTLGNEAYKFIDFLKEAGQTYWQILPVCPTGYGDSPYQSFSTFAGNPYFIDLKLLEEEGLLEKKDYSELSWGQDPMYVDFGAVYEGRIKVFEKVQCAFEKNIPDDFNAFCKENSFWLEDYALFMAVKDLHNGASFLEWEEDIRLRKAEALDEWKKKSADRMNYYRIQQYLFFKQWKNLKTYANKNGIKIIGDIPIYVSADSADVWTHPKNFMLDKNLIPIEVAGCPPDAFTSLGQLWGNPVYNWDFMKKDGYSWWKMRLKQSLKVYDLLRIDHFRGFDSFYSIKYGAADAKNGKWEKGPGLGFFEEIRKTFGQLPVIAEDLGFLTDSVRNLLKDCGFPGMKVLQFAFDSRDSSSETYLPENYTENCVVYTGTHDNDTINGWTQTAFPEDIALAMKYYKLSSPKQLRKAMMLSAMNTKACICILTMQDIIGCGSEGRMNRPSSVGMNWKWRALSSQITKERARELKDQVLASGRA